MWLVLAVRILLVGTERVLLRVLGEGRPPAETAAAFFATGALVLLPFAAPWASRDWAILRVALPSAAVYAVAYWLYVSALSQGEVSAVAPLGALAGVFVVPLAFFVHGEGLGVAKWLGVGVITLSASLLGSSARGGSLRVANPAGVDVAPATRVLTRAMVRVGLRCGRDVVAAPGLHRLRGWRPASPASRARWMAFGRGAAWQMVGYALLTATTRMLDKTAAQGVPGAAALYAWVVFSGVALCQCGLLAVTGGLGGLHRLGRSRPWVMLSAGVCNGGSFLLLIVALARVPVSVAEPVTALSLLVSAGLAWLVFREPVRSRWWPTLGVIAGTWLLVAGRAG